MPASRSFQPAAYPSAPQAAAWRYGGFWIRFLARIIDWIVVGVIVSFARLPLRIMGLLSLSAGGIDLTAPRDPSAWIALLPAMIGFAGISFFISIAIHLAYEVYFLSTRGATPGKMILGLKVIRADGGPISPALAAGRYFAMWLSGLTLFIGFIIAGFDPEKRALHDHICQTRVIHAR